MKLRFERYAPVLRQTSDDAFAVSDLRTACRQIEARTPFRVSQGSCGYGHGFSRPSESLRRFAQNAAQPTCRTANLDPRPAFAQNIFPRPDTPPRVTSGHQNLRAKNRAPNAQCAVGRTIGNRAMNPFRGAPYGPSRVAEGGQWHRFDRCSSPLGWCPMSDRGVLDPPREMRATPPIRPRRVDPPCGYPRGHPSGYPHPPPVYRYLPGGGANPSIGPSSGIVQRSAEGRSMVIQ